MSTDLARFIALAPLGVLLTWAAVQDVRQRRIRNWLTFSLMLAGLLQSLAGGGIVSAGQAVLGLLTGLALTVFLFAAGVLKAGDVKLLAAVGAWVGPSLVLEIFVLAAVAGGLVAVIQSIWHHRLLITLQDTLVMGNDVLSGKCGSRQAREASFARLDRRQTVPCAVAIWIATMMALFTPIVSVISGRPL